MSHLFMNRNVQFTLCVYWFIKKNRLTLESHFSESNCYVLRALQEDMKSHAIVRLFSSTGFLSHHIQFSKVTKTSELQEKLSEQLDRSSDNNAHVREFRTQ